MIPDMDTSWLYILVFPALAIGIAIAIVWWTVPKRSARDEDE